jgi:hypothetical protein
MSARNVLRLLQAALLGGEKLIGMKAGDALKVLPVADDVGSVQIGDGTTDMDVKVFLGTTAKYALFDVGNSRLEMNGADTILYGNIATAYAELDASASQLGMFGPMRLRGFNSLSPRYELKWTAGARGKPSLNADIQNSAEGTRMIADPDFEILGTNASSDDVTFYVEGGITIETDGADNDQVIILPHLDANQTAWAQVTWGTDQETEWECSIRTAAAVTAMTIWCGLKLTNTSVTATDDDQAFFRYAAATNSGKWQAVSSRAGVDVETDTGVTVAAATDYHLKITIDADRMPRFYINGVLVDTGAALVNAKDLIPYIGVHANAAAAKSIVVRGQAISRKAA